MKDRDSRTESGVGNAPFSQEETESQRWAVTSCPKSYSKSLEGSQKPHVKFQAFTSTGFTCQIVHSGGLEKMLHAGVND